MVADRVEGLAEGQTLRALPISSLDRCWFRGETGSRSSGRPCLDLLLLPAYVPAVLRHSGAVPA